MARIQAQRSKSAAPAADARRRLLTNRKRPAYQVVLEQVTQKYKKLITVVCSSAVPAILFFFHTAPDTFGFVYRDLFRPSHQKDILSYLQGIPKSQIDVNSLRDWMALRCILYRYAEHKLATRSKRQLNDCRQANAEQTCRFRFIESVTIFQIRLSNEHV